jgi:glucose/arabinose dehydrogenase/mono/diheme cytochrome c family protein
MNAFFLRPLYRVSATALCLATLILFLYACRTPSADEKPLEEPGFQSPRTVKNDATPAYLNTEESLGSFRMPKGYHAEIVADEEMLNEPVAISWDGNGRMFVTQMETYMQTVDTTGEHVATSRVLLLEDTDDDGRMDKRTVFIDKLMLPRMILAVGNELLVNVTDTYDIYAYKDTNNDGVADQKRLVYHANKRAYGNLEHQRSGLDWNIDNWIYITVDPLRFKYRNGKLTADSLLSGSNGQWGLTHDNYGRLFYARGGAENAGSGFHINPAYGQLEFQDAYIDSVFGPVWPIVKTPDVQGGLARIRPDTTLNHFTAANGQSIYRGDHLPRNLVGDYLIAEPVARIIRRAKVVNTMGKHTLENVYDREEFIASWDMNFRPVNTYTGPDGCLYIVDMHRGIIQEGTWTGEGSYLRKQILRLGLDKNVQHGRILRVTYDGMGRGPKPHMLDESPAQLVTYLDHPNGWWRDNAQKELVLRNDKSVVPALQDIAMGKKGPLKEKPGPLGRIHALWTLSGLEAIDEDILLKAFGDEDAAVRKTAIWISDAFLKKNNERVLTAVTKLKDDKDYDVRVQLLLSLSQSTAPAAKEVMNQLMEVNKENPMIAGTRLALERNEEIRKFGAKLGSLKPEQRTMVSEGAAIFNSLCATCHGERGKGVPTQIAPPLAGQFMRYMGKKDALMKILLHGLTGPVNGKTYRENMMPMGMNDDKWIASVLSFLRYDIGMSENPFPGSPNEGFVNFLLVKPEEVARVRAEFKGRTKPWTWEELNQPRKP